MNRRDTIIVAVLLNAAIIAVLLIMAVNTDEEVVYDRPAALAAEGSVNQKSVQESKMETSGNALTSTAISSIELENNHFDGMLSDFSSTPEEFFLADDELSIVPEKPLSQPAEKPVVAQQEAPGTKVVDIVVKKGDSLDKIARANGTTIEAIKQLNQLKSVNLSIGQRLKVPVGYKPSSPIASAPKAPVNKPTEPSNAEYYTVRSGDTPWKIAKQQHVSMDDILRLNQLNEEKARNLKIGDRIRIR